MDWTERRPAGDVDRNWSHAAGDMDGSVLIVANDKRLYVSTDTGVNWTEHRPAGNVDVIWSSVAVDNNGAFLVVTGFYDSMDRMWVSSDGGTNWTEMSAPDDEPVDVGWFHAATDADGSNLFSATGWGMLHTSVNSGGAWTTHDPSGTGSEPWISTASDADGSVLLAAITPGRIYLSGNGGSTWAETQPYGDRNCNWYSVATNATGQILMAGGQDGLFISVDGGVNWTRKHTETCLSVVCDKTGKRMFGSKEGGILISLDTGATWEEIRPAGIATDLWRALTIDASGCNLLAGMATGRLYTTYIPLPPVPHSFPWQGRFQLSHVTA